MFEGQKTQIPVLGPLLTHWVASGSDLPQADIVFSEPSGHSVGGRCPVRSAARLTGETESQRRSPLLGPTAWSGVLWLGSRWPYNF